MNSARMTILMPPDRKAAIEQRAFQRGVSSGEYARNAFDSYEAVSEAEEAELAALVAEVNKAIPRMAASIDEMSRKLRETHEEVDRMLRAMGARS
jgi:hypothetical protein